MVYKHVTCKQQTVQEKGKQRSFLTRVVFPRSNLNSSVCLISLCPPMLADTHNPLLVFIAWSKCSSVAMCCLQARSLKVQWLPSSTCWPPDRTRCGVCVRPSTVRTSPTSWTSWPPFWSSPSSYTSRSLGFLCFVHCVCNRGQWWAF